MIVRFVCNVLSDPKIRVELLNLTDDFVIIDKDSSHVLRVHVCEYVEQLVILHRVFDLFLFIEQVQNLLFFQRSPQAVVSLFVKPPPPSFSENFDQNWRPITFMNIKLIAYRALEHNLVVTQVMLQKFMPNLLVFEAKLLLFIINMLIPHEFVVKLTKEIPFTDFFYAVLKRH